MLRDVVEFRITNLDVNVPSGFPVMWHGYKISTGPLDFGLAAVTSKPARVGVGPWCRGLPGKTR